MRRSLLVRLLGLLEEREVRREPEAPVPLVARLLGEELEVRQREGDPVRGHERDADLLRERVGRDEGLLEQRVDRAEEIPALPAAAFGGNASRALSQLDDLPRAQDRLGRDLLDAAEEEPEPRLPVSVDPYGLQAVVVLGAVLLEEPAQVQERQREHLPLTEQERHEQPSDAPVAVEERVDRLELRVGEPGVHERRERLIVQELLEVAENVHELPRWRRHERRVSDRRGAGADPVLRPPELARIAMLATHALHELGVDLANEP